MTIFPAQRGLLVAALPITFILASRLDDESKDLHFLGSYQGTTSVVPKTVPLSV